MVRSINRRAAKSRSDVAASAQKHDLYERVGSIEEHGRSMENRLGAVEKNQQIHGVKLDDIFKAVSHHRSFDVTVAIDVAYKAAVLFGLITAGIVYIASNLNASQGAVTNWRLQQIEDKLGRTTVLEKKGILPQ